IALPLRDRGQPAGEDLGRRFRHRLRPPKQCSGKSASDAGVAIARKRLSRPTVGKRCWRVELYHHFDGPEADHAPNMRRQIDVAIPCEERPIEASNGDAVESGVWDGEGLNETGEKAVSVFSGGKQCIFKGEYAFAVAAGPLRKQDQRIPDRQSPAYRVALCDGAAYSPIHEDTAL